METKHTPGPWEVSANGWVEPTRGHQVLYVRHSNEMVAQCWKTGNDRGLTDEQRKSETEANARLIAEAGTVATETGLTPRQLAEQRAELLAALLEIVDHADKYGAAPKSATKMFDRAQTAIAKTKGNQQ